MWVLAGSAVSGSGAENQRFWIGCFERGIWVKATRAVQKEMHSHEKKSRQEIAGPTIRLRRSIEVIDAGIELKSLILAQIERWRNALHMQVERQRGRGNLTGGERRTGE